jgi:hypothetical protein
VPTAVPTAVPSATTILPPTAVLAPSPGATAEYSVGLSRAIWIVGAVLVVAVGIVAYVVAQGSSNDTPTIQQSSDGAATGSIADLAARYTAIADEANARDDSMNQEAQKIQVFGQLGALPTEEAKDLLRRMAASTRDFDAKLAQIPFPPAIAADAQAVIDADSHIASGLELTASGCSDPCTAYADAAPYFDVRTQAITRLRADLGLPPPS